MAENTLQIMMDYLAAGLDPQKSVIFQQSVIPEHAELHLLLSMVTPLGWLERVPTYKEALENVKDKDLHNYGFLGYPVLQMRRHCDLQQRGCTPFCSCRRGSGFARRDSAVRSCASSIFTLGWSFCLVFLKAGRKLRLFLLSHIRKSSLASRIRLVGVRSKLSL